MRPDQPTARQRPVTQRARQIQSAARQARRAARLAHLGLLYLVAYLQCRIVEQGWSIRRIRAELAVSRNWLVAEMARVGFRQ